LHIINREHWQPQAKTIDEEIGIGEEIGGRKIWNKRRANHIKGVFKRLN